MKKIYTLALLLVLSFSQKAQIITSAATGNWNTTTTWVGGVVPTSANSVVIATGHSVTLISTTSLCSAFTLSAGSTLILNGKGLTTSSNFTSAGSITGSGNIRFTGNATITTTVAISNTALSLAIVPGVGKTIAVAAGSSFNLNVLTVGTGTTNNFGTLTINNRCDITVGSFNNSTNGVISNTGNFALTSGGTFTATGIPNTITLTGSLSTSIPSMSYYNLSMDGGAGLTVRTKTLAGNITVTGTITLASNVTVSMATFGITLNNATWINNNSTASGNLTNLGTLTLSGASPTIRRKTGVATKEVFGSVVLNSSGTFNPNSTNTAGYTGNMQCTNLTLTAGTFNLNAVGSYTLDITGNLVGNGGNFGTNGLVKCSGTTAQTISGTTALNFTNLTVSNAAGVSTTTAQNLLGTLTVSAGTFTSNTADFTLISSTSASNGTTGRVATLVGSISGNKWVVQRAIVTLGANTTTPYWGDYSSPTQSSTLTDWDNEMYLSGVGGADGQACCPTFYSVQDWEGTAAATNVTSLVNLTPGKGFDIWTGSSLTSLSPFLFDTKGTPNSGTISHSASAAGYYNMGNPYPSQIKWSLLTRNNIGNYYYQLDESLSDYATWDETATGGASGTGKLSGSGGVINSSQGMLVEATGAGSIQFTESSKVSTAVTFVRLAAPKEEIQFHFSQGQQQRGMTNRICFAEGAYNGKDENDMGYPSASFLQKRYVAKTLSKDGQELCKNTLNLNEDIHEIPLVFIPAEQGLFTLNFDGLKDFSVYNCVLLEDVIEGTFTDLKSNPDYTFKAKNTFERRFVIHFVRTLQADQASCISKSDAFKIVAANMPIAKVFVNESGIVMNFSYKELTKVKVVIYNAIGSVISTSEQSYSEGQFILNKPQVQGIYLINLTDGKKSETHRVFID